MYTLTIIIFLLLFPGYSISDETEEFAIRVPVSRPLVLHPNSDQEVITDTDTDVATTYRDDGNTHNQSKPLRKL